MKLVFKGAKLLYFFEGKGADLEARLDFYIFLLFLFLATSSHEFELFFDSAHELGQLLFVKLIEFASFLFLLCGVTELAQYLLSPQFHSLLKWRVGVNKLHKLFFELLGSLLKLILWVLYLQSLLNQQRELRKLHLRLLDLSWLLFDHWLQDLSSSHWYYINRNVFRCIFVEGSQAEREIVNISPVVSAEGESGMPRVIKLHDSPSVFKGHTERPYVLLEEFIDEIGIVIKEGSDKQLLFHL